MIQHKRSGDRPIYERICSLVRDLRLSKHISCKRVFENRQPATEAKFIIKSSLFILLLSLIRRQEPKLIANQEAENKFIVPPYCQAQY